MEHKSRSLTPAEFFEDLQHDRVAATAPLTMTGMVKKAEGKDKAIQFAAAGNCSSWVTIPLDMIEEVEVLKAVPCKDHTHPLVRLGLKGPTNAEARVFAALLQAVPPAPPAPEPIPPALAQRQATDPWGDPICGPGTHKRCYPTPCIDKNGDKRGWCTVCQCEPIFNPEPFPFAPYWA